MALLPILAALRTRFVTQWGTTVQTVYANAEATEVNHAEPFVRFMIQATESDLVAGSSADGLQRQNGRVWLQIFVPQGEGTTLGYELAEKFALIFRHHRDAVAGVRCGSETMTAIPSGENGIFQINVSVPFEGFTRL